MELEQLIQKFKDQESENVTSYEEPGVNRFDAPIPGQSLTDTPGNYPWEHAPKTASIEEATDFVYEAMMKPENMERMFTLLRMGIPIEALVKIITFSGFLGTTLDIGTNRILSGILCLIMIFMPSFLLVLGLMPYWDFLRRKEQVRRCLSGINACVVGLLIATFLSFMFSFFTIKYFLKFISKISFNIFVIYRIILGLILFYIIYI